MSSTSKPTAKKATSDSLFEKCKIQLSFEKIYDWADNEIQSLDKAKNSGEVSFPSKKDFAKKILPNSLQQFFPVDTSYCSRLFNPSKETFSRYRKARNHLLKVSESDAPIIFEMHPVCRELTENWVKFLNDYEISLQGLPGRIRQLLDSCIVSGGGSFPTADRLRRRIDALLGEKGSAKKDVSAGENSEIVSPVTGCAQALATMSLIACTLFYWNELPDPKLGSKGNDPLYDLVLPSSTSSRHAETLKRARKQIDRSEAFDLSLPENQELLQRLSEIAKSCQGDSIGGWAWYLLHLAYQLSGNNEFLPQSTEYLKKAVEQGCPEARHEQEQNASNRTAQNLLAEAQREYPNNVGQAYGKCRELLALRPEPSDMNLIGRAAMLIYDCSQDYYKRSGKSLLPDGETPEQYLKKSRDCGNEKAIRLCADHLSILPRLSRSGDDSEGVYYFNCCNPLTKQIQATAPANWKQAWEPDANGGTQTEPAQNARYYFLDNDQIVNLRDALRVLDALQNSTTGQGGNDCEGPELYIRGQTEFLRPLLDTASRMTGRMVPLYLIDDDLWPAQWLLAHHPLFYPIRSLPETSPSTLNLVVVGSTRCSEWVVREAFSLMGFVSEKVDCKITVIAPLAEEFQKSLFFKCPGLSEVVNIARLPRPPITFLSCEDGFQSREIESLLLSCYQQQDAFCYYVIDTGDDAVNLSLASRLREMLIRAVLSGPYNNQKAKLNAPPPIAFCCRDPFTAHLSKRLVTEMESYGDQWYNSPCLIPFGSSLDRYTWQNATGGFYEIISKNIHLQYSFALHKGPLTQNECDSITRESLSDYFSRCYNRESSMSVAISLPYRLFQFEISGAEGSRHLIPSCWQITDPNAYCAEVQRNALGLLLKDALRAELKSGQRADTQAEHVAKWEHDRWSRWMLARGWMPESVDQTLDCHTYGNKRPQLFLARLHPCICAYDSLEQLANAWNNKIDKKKETERDFVSLDRKTIQNTSDVLELKWYGREPAAQEERSEEPERG